VWLPPIPAAPPRSYEEGQVRCPLSMVSRLQEKVPYLAGIVLDRSRVYNGQTGGNGAYEHANPN